MYPGEVHCATVVANCDQLKKLVQGALVTRDALERDIMRLKDGLPDGVMRDHASRCCGWRCCCAVQRQKHEQRLRKLNADIVREQKSVVSNIQVADDAAHEFMARGWHHHPTNFGANLMGIAKRLAGIRGSDGSERAHGFVSFKTLRSANMARQVLHDSHVLEFCLTVIEAPSPDDLIWRSLTMAHKERSLHQLLAFTFEALMLIFWMVPVVALMSFTSQRSLKEHFPFLENVMDANVCLLPNCAATTAAIIEGAAPSIAVSTLMLILPLLLELTTTYSGVMSHHEVERGTVLKFFGFLYFNIFLVSALGGTFVDSLDTVLNNPRAVPSMLGERLPARAKFFLSYILLDLLLYFPVMLLQLSPLITTIMYNCVHRCGCRHLTPRQRDSMREPSLLSDNTYAIPKMLMVITLTQTFCLIAPVLLMAATIVFAIANVVYRYLFLYTYKQKFDSGGLLWPAIVRCITVGTLSFQLTLIGVLLLKQGFWESVCLAPLPLLTLLADRQFAHRFEASGRLLPLMECHALGVQSSAERSRWLDSFLSQAYLNPSVTQPKIKVDARVMTKPGAPETGASHRRHHQTIYFSPQQRDEKRAAAIRRRVDTINGVRVLSTQGKTSDADKQEDSQRASWRTMVRSADEGMLSARGSVMEEAEGGGEADGGSSSSFYPERERLFDHEAVTEEDRERLQELAMHQMLLRPGNTATARASEAMAAARTAAQDGTRRALLEQVRQAPSPGHAGGKLS
jgi:hypothetical protein